MVVAVCSSEEEFQALAMRLAARVLLPGTGNGNEQYDPSEIRAVHCKYLEDGYM